MLKLLFRAFSLKECYWPLRSLWSLVSNCILLSLFTKAYEATPACEIPAGLSIYIAGVFPISLIFFPWWLQIKFASVKLAKMYMKRVAMELQYMGPLNKDPALEYMLLQAVRFAFRMHQVTHCSSNSQKGITYPTDQISNHCLRTSLPHTDIFHTS